jgi:hypothetical protein
MTSINELIAAATMLDIEKLKAAALKATPGPWLSGANECLTQERALAICKESIDTTTKTIPYFFEVFLENGLRTALVGNGPTSWENADYIALANPAAILALIERLQVAEDADRKIESLEAALKIALNPICPANCAGEGGYANGWNDLKKLVNDCQLERRDAAIAARRLTP